MSRRARARRSRGRRRWRPAAPRALLGALLASVLLAIGSLAGAASVPGMRRGGVIYAPADAVARALGDIVTAGSGSLTWRARRGTLTVFDGSPDALWQASGQRTPKSIALSAPVLLQGGRWWLPLDAFDTVGLTVQDGELVLPGGGRLTLEVPAPPASGGGTGSEVDDLGHGVPALRLFADGGGGAGSAAAGAPTVAAMLSDLDMLPLVEPAQRAAIDAALQGSGADKPLLVVVTALEPTGWQPTFRLSQGGRELEFRFPYRMRLVEGQAGKVGPDAPAAMLLLLPSWFNLYRPITVSWQGASGTVTFRR